MKPLIFFMAALCISLTTTAQEMQTFNDAYYKKYEKVKANIIAKKDSLNKLLVAGTKNPKKDSLSKAQEDSLNKSLNVNEVSAFPAFTDLLGKNVLLPQLQIKGFTNLSLGKSVYGDIKLFTSAFAVKNFTNVSLFFPDASVYGISMAFNWLPFGSTKMIGADDDAQKMKWFCLYLNANYLGKNLQGIDKNGSTSDTTRFTSDVGHIKLGFQIIPKVNFLSFYADVNFLLPVVNRDQLLSYNPLMKKGSSNFFHIGTKFFITSGEEKPMRVFVDFSAIVVDKVTKTLYQTNDALIPRISIGGSAKF